MELSLIHQIGQNTNVAAAFIRGKTPQTWLKMLDFWQISIEKLLLFAIPESMHTAQPAGLFVIFETGKIPDLNKIQYPYQKIGQKLFIPTQSRLFPEILPQELNELIYWEFQVFHPHIGMIGFEEKDQIQNYDLLEFTVSSTKDWSLAENGIPNFPRLSQISIQKPENEEGDFLLDSLKGEIGTKSLKNIISKDNNNNEYNENEELPPPFLERVLNWFMGQGYDIKQNKEPDLEKQREAALDHLLKLFEQNLEEALQYALPLDTPGESRGQAVEKKRN
jgi:hypothetical protein